MSFDQNDQKLFDAWQEAESLAKDGDTRKLVELLRSQYVPYEVPDLWFLADLLEGKFKKSKGRPSRNKISAGLDQRLAAEAVAHIITTQKVSVEEAVSQAAKVLPMSESLIKQHYVKLGSKKFEEPQLFKAKLDKSFK